MKPQKLLPLLLVLAAVSLAAFFTLRKDPNAPRYVPLTSQPPVIPGQILYNYAGTAPFANGAFWIYTGIGTTNVQIYLYDLEKRKIIGELFNCRPGVCNRDHTKLLCTELSPPLKATLSAFLAKISHGRINLGVKAVQSTYILNLANNKYHRLDSHELSGNFAFGWISSPGGDLALGMGPPINGSAFFDLCDLKAETFRSISLNGDIRGWWDDDHLLVRQPAGDLQLWDVPSGKIVPLVSHEMIAQKLNELHLTNQPADLSVFFSWNGTNTDCFLTDYPLMPIFRYEGTLSFILKLHHTNPAITLFARHFGFRPGGEFDPSQTHYLYVGPAPAPQNPNDGAIYLADLPHHTTTTLFPPLTRDEGTYPRFYGTNLIYVSSNQLWMTTLDAKTQTRLYPPPENK